VLIQIIGDIMSEFFDKRLTRMFTVDRTVYAVVAHMGHVATGFFITSIFMKILPWWVGVLAALTFIIIHEIRDAVMWFSGNISKDNVHDFAQVMAGSAIAALSGWWSWLAVVLTAVIYFLIAHTIPVQNKNL
jgi:hypothetical protein